MSEDSHILDQSVRYTADDPLYYIYEKGIDIKANHIYLTGETAYTQNLSEGNTEEPGVEHIMASNFIKNMNVLIRKNPGVPILIHMKTCGGDWNEGMAIYNMIKSCPVPVTILNYTHARSMSSLIFQAANKRVMMPDSYFMFHDGTGEVGGTVKQIYSAIDFSRMTDQRMLDIYVEAMKRSGKFSKKSKEAIRNWLREQMDKKEDVYLTAEEAVSHGFADEIFGKDGKYNWNSLLEYSKEELERG